MTRCSLSGCRRRCRRIRQLVLVRPQPLTDHRSPSTVHSHCDKLHEECGVVAIHGHPDAARQAYLGLYALQHRGQESAGIATANGLHLANIKGMGLVSEIFTDDVLQSFPAPWPSATPATPLPATPPCSTPSPSASTPPRASSPLLTTATSLTSAIARAPGTHRRVLPNHERLRNHRPAHRTLTRQLAG